MADWAKIALKVGLVAIVMAALWAVFTQVQIPAIDFSVITQSAGLAMAVISYYCPAFTVVWNTTLAILAMFIALWTFRFGAIVWRWLFKVNE